MIWFTFIKQKYNINQLIELSSEKCLDKSLEEAFVLITMMRSIQKITKTITTKLC